MASLDQASSDSTNSAQEDVLQKQPFNMVVDGSMFEDLPEAAKDAAPSTEEPLEGIEAIEKEPAAAQAAEEAAPAAAQTAEEAAPAAAQTAEEAAPAAAQAAPVDPPAPSTQLGPPDPPKEAFQLGKGSNVEGFFDEDDDDLDFTDADLDGLPLFDEMDGGLDGDPLKPDPVLDAPTSESVDPSMEATEEEEVPPEEEKSAARVRIALKMPACLQHPWAKKAAILVAAGVVLICAAMGLVSIFSSSPSQEDSGAYATNLPDSPVNPESTQNAGPADPTAQANPRLEIARPLPMEKARPVIEPPPETAVENDHFAQGVHLFRSGRYAEAIEEFESDITSASLFLARCYQILGENEEALKRYQRVLWEYPDKSAFVEVYALAEEMYTAGHYEGARKLYYAFISQADRMPGTVKKLVSKAYFKICCCLEEEAIASLQGTPLSASSTLSRDPVHGGPSLGTASPDQGETNPADRAITPPYKIAVQSEVVNDFLTLFSLECMSAPCLGVLKELAAKAGRDLVMEEKLETILAAEMVSAFLKDKQLDEILEYVTGQTGATYKLEGPELRVMRMEDLVKDDWLAMKDEAIKAFRRSLYRFMGHEDAAKVYFEISRLHYLSGDFDSAITPARTLIVEYPEYSQVPMALLNISNCYMELEDYGKAREFLTELANKYPNHPAAQEGMLLLADCWMEEGNPVVAERTLINLADRYPDSPVIYEGRVTLARIQNSLGQFGDVIRLVDQIPMNKVGKVETVISLQLLKSEAQLRSGDAVGAVSTAVALLEVHPDHERSINAYYILAEAYTDLDQPFLAFAQCRTLRTRYTSSNENPHLYLMAARALRKLGMLDEALEWLDTGLEMCLEGMQNTHDMYMLLGDILFEGEKFERAKVVFRKVAECDAYEKEAMGMYIRAQMAQQDYHGALMTLREELDGAFEDQVYKGRLCKMAGDCFQALGDLDAAINAYKGEIKEMAGGGSNHE